MVDVVDEHDRVVAVVSRAQMRVERLRHRSVAVAVLSTDGRLLVHRRSDAKDLWPGRWDLAAGGVVAAGEDYGVAARRELAEELGLELGEGGVKLTPLGGGTYVDADVVTMGRCYSVVHDGPFRLVDGEVAETRWVTREELGELRRTEAFVPDSVAVLLPLLESTWPASSPM